MTSLQWRRMRSAAGERGLDLAIASMELPASTGAGHLRLAVGPAGEAMLLIPLDPAEGFPDLVAGRALGVRDVTLGLRHQATRFLELSCPDPRLEQVFEELVDQITQRLQEGADTARAVTGTIDEFRELLARSGAREPGVERVIGLLAELRWLNALLEISPRAWRCWTGPEGARHDFRAGSAALECKATLRSQGHRVTITSVDQLMAPPGGELHLNLQIFETDTAGLHSLEVELRRARRLASDVQQLEVRMRAAGLDLDDPALREMRFSLLDEATYRVTPGFPRIVPEVFIAGGLPAGVRSLAYDIDLGSAASAFRVPETDVHPLIRAMADAA